MIDIDGMPERMYLGTSEKKHDDKEAKQFFYMICT